MEIKDFTVDVLCEVKFHVISISPKSLVWWLVAVCDTLLQIAPWMNCAIVRSGQ